MEYNVLNLYSKYFGAQYVRAAYQNTQNVLEGQAAAPYTNPPLPILVTEKTSYLNTPLMLPTTLGFPGENEFDLPGEPIISIKLDRKIIETELDNINGTFKEGFSNGDYVVELRGIIFNDYVPDLNDQQEMLPEVKLRLLRELVYDQFTSIPIINKLANIFNINDIVIYNLDIQQVAGEIGYIPYTITAKSDFKHQLIISGV